MRIDPIINPFSSEYQCCSQFKEISRWQKVAAVAAAILGSVIPVLGTTYVFRKFVTYFVTTAAAKEDAKLQNNRHLLIKWEGDASEKLVITRKPAYPLDYQIYINIFKELSKLGIGPNDVLFDFIGIVPYVNRNGCTDYNMYGDEGPFEGKIENKSVRDHFIVVARNDKLKEAYSVRGNRELYTVLSYEQVNGKSRLPETFVKLLRKGKLD